MLVVFAALPIATILVLMLGFGWSAAKAGAVGLGLTIVLALRSFEFSAMPAGWPPVWGLGGALLEAAFIALTILWIIFPALCIYELQEASGSIEVLRKAIAGLSSDPRIAALLIAWFFALFMEGAAGFGTSAALAAPFLVGMGMAKLQAVCIALVGHAVGVSFGAVGTPLQAQLTMGALPALELSAATALYHALLGWIMALAVLQFSDRALPQTYHANGRAVGWTLFAAFSFLLPYYLLARFIGPELPTLGGSVIGAAVFGAVLLLRSNRVAASSTLPASAVLRAAAPYLLLMMLILFTRLLPLGEFLRALEIRWQLGTFSGRMAPLYHPGSMLLLSFFGAAAIQGVARAQLRGAMAKALRRLGTVSLALFAMLGLSRLMVHAGMIEVLAIAAAGSMGALWPLLAPFVGVLGTFVTGSATASNILFSDFQLATARSLQLPVIGMLGAQGFGAAVGNIVCPHNIIAANAVVKLPGQEAAVLRRTLPVMFVYTALGGLLAWLFV